MARRMFLLLISVFVAMVGNPTFLSATDEPPVVGINPAGIVETIPLPEPEPEPVSFETPSAPMAGLNAANASLESFSAPVASTIENYTVTYQVASAKEFNALAYNLSYSDIYRFRKMIYGHNASNLLLSLAYKNVNDIITVTENGIVGSYQIVWKREMLKVSENDLQDMYSGQIYAMKDISWALDTYDLALETCSGYGNTPYRWVLFANKI